MHDIEDLHKCLFYSWKLLLKSVLAFYPAFVSQIAYKNAIQFGNTLGEVELLLGTVEAWPCMGLSCGVLLAPLFSYSLFYKCRLIKCSVKLSWSSMFIPIILLKLAVGLSF